MTDIQITEEKRNDLFGRVEITGIASTKEGTTPTRKDVEKAIADKMKTKPTHVEIDGIFQKFGKHEAEIKAKVWDKPVREEEKAPEPVTEETSAAEEGGEASKEEAAPAKEETKAEEAKEEKKEE